MPRSVSCLVHVGVRRVMTSSGILPPPQTRAYVGSEPRGGQGAGGPPALLATAGAGGGATVELFCPPWRQPRSSHPDFPGWGSPIDPPRCAPSLLRCDPPPTRAPPGPHSLIDRRGRWRSSGSAPWFSIYYAPGFEKGPVSILHPPQNFSMNPPHPHPHQHSGGIELPHQRER